jgi:hypothetical protein
VASVNRDEREALADPRSSDSVSQESSDEIGAYQIAVIADARGLFRLDPFSSLERLSGKKNLERNSRYS